jgi:hypothetical protein
MVKEQLLDRLLDRGEIAGFQRTDGWAVVGRDHIRQRSRQAEKQYQGPERRGTNRHVQVARV